MNLQRVIAGGIAAGPFALWAWTWRWAWYGNVEVRLLIWRSLLLRRWYV